MTQETVATEKFNGMNTAGMILGIIAVVFSFIPFIGLIAWPLSVVGVALSGVGFAQTTKLQASNKGMAIAGLTLNIVALAICIIWTVAVGSIGMSA